MSNKITSKLKEIVGEDYVLHRSLDTLPYTRDYNPLLLYLENLRNKIRHPDIVVQPGSVEELLEVLKLVDEYGLTYSVYGGGSGVLQAYTPEVDVVIDLIRFNWIKWFDRESNIVYVGSGTYLIQVEEWLNKQGYTLGHYPQSIHVTSVGGAIATGSIGMYSSGYGGIEDILAGIEIVTSKYGLIRYGPTVRPNTPLSLNWLLLNSEGRFGVITGAYLKVYRKPDVKIGSVVKLDSYAYGVKVLKNIVDYRIEPHLIRLFDEYESTLYFKSDKPVLIYEVHGYTETEEITKSHIDTLNKLVKGVKLPTTLLEEWKSSRYRYIDYISRLYEMGIVIETMEYGVKWSKAVNFTEKVRSKLLENPAVVYVSSHISHIHRTGCGIYFTIGLDIDKVVDEYLNIWRDALDIAVEYGCDISHHHGIGRIRHKYLEKIYGENYINLIKDFTRMLRLK